MKNRFETLEQELSELDCMSADTVIKFYGVDNQTAAKDIIINTWREEYSEQEIEDALRFVEELKTENK